MSVFVVDVGERKLVRGVDAEKDGSGKVKTGFRRDGGAGRGVDDDVADIGRVRDVFEKGGVGIAGRGGVEVGEDEVADGFQVVEEGDEDVVVGFAVGDVERTDGDGVYVCSAPVVQ